jgi:hypothetical protein
MPAHETHTLPSGHPVRLGRIRPKARPPALRLAAYLDPANAPAPPPATLDYVTKALPAVRTMLGNDQYGDCVIAGQMHSVGVRTAAATGTPAVGTTQEAVSQYRAICGPGDQGCVITDVLDYAHAHGITVGGKTYRIDGYVSVDWTNKLEVQYALWLFGTLKLGLNLPRAWLDSEDVWDVPSGAGAGIVGGHDVEAAGYDGRGVTVLTWGGTRLLTWPAFLSTKWLEECYAALAPEWYSKGNVSPSGLDVASLQQDLQKIGGGGLPPIVPGPAPDPTPPPTPPPPAPPPTPPPTPPPVALTLLVVNVTAKVVAASKDVDVRQTHAGVFSFDPAGKTLDVPHGYSVIEYPGGP